MDSNHDAPFEANYWMSASSSETARLPAPKIQLQTGDALAIMRTMPAGSIDLIVTSPPYNIGKRAGKGGYPNKKRADGSWGICDRVGYDQCGDDMTLPEYVAWQQECLREMWRLIPNDGAIYYNVQPRQLHKQMVNPLDLVPDECTVRQVITWVRGRIDENGEFKKAGIGFSNAHYLNAFEWIILLAKPDFKLAQGANMQSNVWIMQRPPTRVQDKTKFHPYVFPVELPRRCIASTNAKTVLDPFSGSATTGVACIELGRQYLGIDLSPDYTAKSKLRLEGLGASVEIVPTVPKLVAPAPAAPKPEFHCLDYRYAVPSIPDASVQLVVADLPYGSTRHAWDDKNFDLDEFWTHMKRIVAPNGWVVAFGNDTIERAFASELLISNRPWFKQKLIWEKNRPTGFAHASDRHLNAYDEVLLFSPGASAVNGHSDASRRATYNPQGLVTLATPRKRGTDERVGSHLGMTTFKGGYEQTQTNFPRNVLRFDSVTGGDHPTQKPVDLLAYLIRTFSNAGDTVFDPTAGVASTGVAALQEGRKFIGCEIDRTFFEIGCGRLGLI
jgi:site-specific DNA-methyltransferase (adenine-specific)